MPARIASGMATAAASLRAQVSPITWIGLLFSLFGLTAIRQAIKLINPSPGISLISLREAIMLASAGGLILLVRRLEKLPLTSIGLGTSKWWKSILFGVLITVSCLAAALVFAKATGFRGGATSGAFDQLPLWLITVVVFRAGFAEELFFRGYAIERFQALGLNRYLAATISLVIFGVSHITGGLANVLIVLVVGGILTGSYLWRRDLAANMIGHTLVDFVLNIVPRLAS